MGLGTLLSSPLPSQASRRTSCVHLIFTNVAGGDRAAPVQDAFILKLLECAEGARAGETWGTGTSCCLHLGWTLLLRGTYLDLCHSLCFGTVEGSSSPKDGSFQLSIRCLSYLAVARLSGTAPLLSLCLVPYFRSLKSRLHLCCVVGPAQLTRTGLLSGG